MKRFSYLLFVILVVGCVACEHDNPDNPSGFTTCVNYPEAPIQIMSNLDESTSVFDCKYINYFNIIQPKDNLYHCCPEKFYHNISCSTEPASGTITEAVGLL